jgi:hypothetical protein
MGTPIVILTSLYFWQRITFDLGGGGIRTSVIPTSDGFKQDTLFHELWLTIGIGDLGGSSAFDGWRTAGCHKAQPGK